MSNIKDIIKKNKLTLFLDNLNLSLRYLRIVSLNDSYKTNELTKFVSSQKRTVSLFITN